MSDLVRFGVAMDRGLLSEFDERIAAQGYENRSEALRDLIRADLTRAAWDGGAHVAATLTVVYENHACELVFRRTAEEGDPEGLVVSSMRVPLDRERSLEVMVLSGVASELGVLAGRLGGTKGVLSCELTLAASVRERALAPGRKAGAAHRRPEERR